jgi:Protein of unknown function (DUF1460)
MPVWRATYTASPCTMMEVTMQPQLILTWDDGPTPPIAANITELAHVHRVRKIEFYWNGASLLRPDIRNQLGIFSRYDIPRTRGGEWIPWLDWFYAQRNGARPLDFAIKLIDPNILSMCRSMSRHVSVEDLNQMICYHGMTHEYSTSPSHPMSLTPEQLFQEFGFFEILVRAAFGISDYILTKGRPPYGSGLRFDIKNGAEKYEEIYPDLLRRSQKARANFEWNAWEVDAEDYYNSGFFDEASVIRSARDIGERFGKPQSRVLMHERYYLSAPRTLERIFVHLVSQTEDACPTQGCLFPERSEYVLELGPRWSVFKLDELLSEANRRDSAGDRLAYIACQFLAENTPFEPEEELPHIDPAIVRARLESFDCFTFMCAMVALSQASCIEEFIRNLRKIRHADQVAKQNSVIRYTSNVVAKMKRYGFVEDVTRMMLPTSLLRRRTVQQLGVFPSGELFLEGPSGDDGVGRPAAITYIPTQSIEDAEPHLLNGDIVLLVTARRVEEYPGLVGHAGIVLRFHRKDPALFLHASMTSLGRRGKRAGVSLSTFWDAEHGVLRDDCKWRPLSRFLKDNLDLWLGIAVFRPVNGKMMRTYLYGPAVCCKPDVTDGGDWSCASVSGP